VLFFVFFAIFRSFFRWPSPWKFSADALEDKSSLEVEDDLPVAVSRIKSRIGLLCSKRRADTNLSLERINAMIYCL